MKDLNAKKEACSSIRFRIYRLQCEVRYIKYLSSGSVCLKMAAELTAAKSILKHEWNFM